ncbi:uncharacterized protein LOC142339111 isoform X2 [Convolutriloba macropyga]|uniref:uncharacterized protein LOC142339111 isoform X2 n=1 Tax=Convolutriloba macropyga TaxID=536237 RepID=UPI003F521D69
MYRHFNFEDETIFPPVESITVPSPGVQNEKRTKQKDDTDNRCNRAKQKFMFVKNGKTGSSTIESIILQIATHHHKHEIVHTRGSYKSLKNEREEIGYFIPVEHQMLKPLNHFQKLFPKSKYLWIASSRKVEDQINSAVRWRNYERKFKGKRFNKTLVKAFKNESSSELEQAFFSDAMSYYLLGSCHHYSFPEFEICASEIMENMDLVIPREKFDESMVILHKITCLPLSDFAYIQMKRTTSDFKLSEENMKTILNYHKKDLWFEQKANEKFDQFFSTFQAEYCFSQNCSREVAQLREENEKLKIACKVIERRTRKRKHLVEFSFDTEMLKKDSKLGLRCLSFSLSVHSDFLLDLYNEVLRETGHDGNLFADELAGKWIRKLNNLNLTFI